MNKKRKRIVALLTTTLVLLLNVIPASEMTSSEYPVISIDDFEKQEKEINHELFCRKV